MTKISIISITLWLKKSHFIRVENTFDYFWNETFLLVIFKCILIFCPSEFAALAYALRSHGSISSIDGQVSACNSNEVWHKTILEELGSLDNECTWENLENTRRKIPNENTVLNTNGWMHFCYLRYYIVLRCECDCCNNPPADCICASALLPTFLCISIVQLFVGASRSHLAVLLLYYFSSSVNNFVNFFHYLILFIFSTYSRAIDSKFQSCFRVAFRARCQTAAPPFFKAALCWKTRLWKR